MEQAKRLEAEWLALNAFRELTKIASKGDIAKSTYDHALELGGALYPDLLGPQSSLLRRDRESDTAKEYRQVARLRSIQTGAPVSPLALIQADITDRQDLLRLARSKKDHARVDQLKRRLALLIDAERFLNPLAHSENQLIFRDAMAVERAVPAFRSGRGYRDFSLPEGNVLRVRVLHPDVPEHVTGADIIYERHSPESASASIVAVQYKIWERKRLYLSDERMRAQLRRLHAFACKNKVCEPPLEDHGFRFPHCAAFIRPTDKLQRADQAFLSTGEHLPICKIDHCKTTGTRGAEVLEYDRIRPVSLAAESFEYLFNTGRIGSRPLSYEELTELYEAHKVESEIDTVVVYAQEFASRHEVGE